MADLSDVTYYLYQQAVAAVYPSGTSQPSAANIDCRIFEGWPIGDQLEMDVVGKMKDPATGAIVARPGGICASVSIYPMLGTGAGVYQILDETYTISPAAIQMTMSLTDNVVTLSGAPASGEFLTLVVDSQHVYSHTGASAAAILAALLADIQINYPGSTATSTTLTIVGSHEIVARQGGKAVLGKVTHRQRHSIMVTVWAPNRVTRNLLAKAVDGLIKQANKVSMPDTSQALVIYSRTNTSDEQQAQSIYRRDLVYDVEYATVEEFPGYTITSVTTSLFNPSNVVIAATTT